VRTARPARTVRTARPVRSVRPARTVRTVSFPVDFFFQAHLEKKSKKTKKKKRKKEKRKKRKMEGEVLGQANYPYIVLGGSLVMCIAVILMGFKM
jgi:hypothetical protein